MVTVARVVGALAACAASGAFAAPAVALPQGAFPRLPGAANPTPCPETGRTDRLGLPQEEAPQALNIPGTPSDRLRTSVAPGAVDSSDRLEVRLGPDGRPVRVQVEQRLRITGVGDYRIYERGPARQSVALDDTPAPVTKFGAVVWQGFSPGRRDLAARLTLDPEIEALRLPLGITLAFRDASGRPQPLGLGGAVPGAGTVTVTLADQTAQQNIDVAAGSGNAQELAHLAETLLKAAATPGREPPVAGRGLPCDLGVTSPARRLTTVAAAQSVAGTVRVLGAQGTVAGPGVTATADGGRIEGTLPGGASTAFTVHVTGACRLELDVSTQPTIDRRTLTPPKGFSSWSAWAASGPDSAARAAATDRVVAAAATAARAAVFYPYLQADLPGRASGTFSYSIDVPARAAAARATLHPKPGPIALAGLALGLILANGAALRRLV